MRVQLLYTAMMNFIGDLYTLKPGTSRLIGWGNFTRGRATLLQRDAMSIWIWLRRQQRGFKWLTRSTTRPSNSTAPSNSATLDLSSMQRRLRFQSSPRNLLMTGLLLSCTAIKSIGRILKEIRSLLVRLFPCHGLVTFSIHHLFVFGFNP